MNLTWHVLRAKLGTYFPGVEIARAQFSIDPAAETATGVVWGRDGARTPEQVINLSSFVLHLLSSGFSRKHRPDRIDRGIVTVDYARAVADVEIFYVKDGQKLRHHETNNF